MLILILGETGLQLDQFGRKDKALEIDQEAYPGPCSRSCDWIKALPWSHLAGQILIGKAIESYIDAAAHLKFTNPMSFLEPNYNADIGHGIIDKALESLKYSLGTMLSREIYGESRLRFGGGFPATFRRASGEQLQRMI